MKREDAKNWYQFRASRSRWTGSFRRMYDSLIIIFIFYGVSSTPPSNFSRHNAKKSHPPGQSERTAPSIDAEKIR